jgi:hypothetical protein
LIIGIEDVRRGSASGLHVVRHTPILLFMGRESGRGHSLPLLPAGSALFEQLPARAIVLDALAPAVGNGIITSADGDRVGVLVIREGVITDAVSVHESSRDYGGAALNIIRSWESASMSAYRWTESAMSLLDPLIHGEPCYQDLRLEWTAWPQLLDDLRSRGATFVVELFTSNGRGVTVLRRGQQVATYSESHPSLGDPELMDVLVAEGAGSVRVLVANGTRPPVQSLPESSSPVVAYRPSAYTTTEVVALLPSLKLLARTRLQRSSGPIEEVIDAAAGDQQSVEWLAGRVREMSVRGFMASTLERLAEDMLALTERA